MAILYLFCAEDVEEVVAEDLVVVVLPHLGRLDDGPHRRHRLHRVPIAHIDGWLRIKS